MARQTYSPATCSHTTSPLYPLAPLFSPQLFFPLKSPQPLLSPTLLPPLSIPCRVVYNPKTFFPVSHNKSHSNSNPFPICKLTPQSLSILLIKCVSPRSPGLISPVTALAGARSGASFSDEVTGVPPPAAVPQGFAVRTETSLLITQPITLNISRLNIQSHSKIIYQSHENNISKFKANVFGKSSCSPLVLSCGVLD